MNRGLTRHRVLVVIVAIAGLAGAWAAARGYSMWSHENSRLQTTREDVLETIAEGRAAYERIAHVPLSTFTDPASLRQALRGALATTQTHGQAPSSEDAQQLVQLASDFVYYRFAQPSPEAYRAWREAQGYTLKSDESLKKNGVNDDYARFAETPAAGATATAMFDGLWRGIRALPIGAGSMPIAIATAPAGVCVAVAPATSFDMKDGPELAGEIPALLWRGKIQGGGRNWYTDPAGGFREALTRRKTVPSALVGIVVETPGAGRYPLTLSYYQDESRRWWLWRINVHNVDPMAVAMIDY